MCTHRMNFEIIKPKETVLERLELFLAVNSPHVGCPVSTW